jgi:3-hydroxyisobutyrate dehydrogenase-like beta-hydroxyacid dehydrogenase
MATRRANPPLTVAVLGAGAMGRPMIGRLLRHGHTVWAHDTQAAAMKALPATVHRASSARQAADAASVVIGCLPTLAAYRRAVLGRHGIGQGQAITLYLHVGTTGAALAGQLAQHLLERGIHTLDAPMTGGPRRVANGTLSVMTAGSRTAQRLAAGVLASYASQVVHVGRAVGMAQALKVHNNLLYIGNLLLASESLLAAQRAGLALPQVLELLAQGSGQNWVTSHMVPHHVLNGRFDFGANLGMLRKDLRAAREEFARLGLDAPMARMVQRRLHQALQQWGEDDDVTAVFKPLRPQARGSGSGKAVL